MEPARTFELLIPFISPNQNQLTQISTYIDLILKWNARTNLTAVRQPEEMVTRHFGESFFAARMLLQPGSTTSVIDVGSGAGFPGLPIGMFASAASVALVESNSKKATFLKEAVFALGLANVKVFNSRAEDLKEQADLVTMRAVEKFDRALPVAAGLVRTGGRLGLLVGEGQVTNAMANMPELIWSEPVMVPGSHSRVLLVGSRQ